MTPPNEDKMVFLNSSYIFPDGFHSGHPGVTGGHFQPNPGVKLSISSQNIKMAENHSNR